MTGPLAHPSFRTLFAAQICSLLAIGLLTVALSLTAYRIGGVAAAGQILGLLLALKMVAYVGFAPLAETVLSGRPRKPVMIGLDIGRLLILLPMVMVTETWQLGALAFLFFVVSSGFTPLFQSVIPDLLPEEADYTRALMLSRIAYTLESVLSPVIAAAVLRLVPGETLFLFSAVAFLGSITALMLTRFPTQSKAVRKGPFIKRAMRGMTIYGQTPRLRGLFLLTFALSVVMAWVLVNTVSYAGKHLGDAETYYPILMAFYGAGAGAGALIVPRLLARLNDRHVMAMGSLGFAALGLLIALPLAFAAMLALWFGFGLAASLVLTPGGLVIARSAGSADRPAVFAAQFSLSHAGWLVAYPLAGFLGGFLTLETALLALCLISVGVSVIALRIWPAEDPAERLHAHPELPDDHPHLHEPDATGPQHLHRHPFHIDDLHPRWI